MKHRQSTLITGGAGFIGYFLARSLAADGHMIVILENFARGREDEQFRSLCTHNNISIIRGDITNPETFDKLEGDFDHIYHLAAINGTENFYKIPDQVLRVNVLGIINILDWFIRQKSGKLLFSSSSETYAGTMKVMGDDFPIPTPEDIPLCIDDPTNVRWSYGGGKLVGELAMHAYAAAHGISHWSIVRYHNIYGPRMGYEHVIPQFIERVLSGQNPFTIYDPDSTRSFCYIDDAIRATRLVMESSQTNGRVIHIGRGDSEISIKQLAQKIFSAARVTRHITTKDGPRGSIKRRCPDVSKLIELGFQPEIDLDEGIQRSYDWYRDKFPQYPNGDRQVDHEGKTSARPANKPISLWFTDFHHKETVEAIKQERLYHFLADAFPVTLNPKDPDFLIYSDVGDRFRSFSCTRIYCTGENSRPNFAECDFAFSFDGTDEKNFRWPLSFTGELGEALQSIFDQRDHATDLLAAKKKFCNFIYRNPHCAQRNHFFRLLSKYKKIDAAGSLFRNTSGLVGRSHPERWEQKLPFIRQYKFTIAFENESRPGYTTEKIIHALAAGSVPIYWGNPHIARIFNPAAFINCHDFSSFKEVVEKIIALDSDDNEYKQYLSASPFAEDKHIVKAESEKAAARFRDIFSHPVMPPISQSVYNRSLGLVPRSFFRRLARHLRRRLKSLQYVFALLLRGKLPC